MHRPHLLLLAGLASLTLAAPVRAEQIPWSFTSTLMAGTDPASAVTGASTNLTLFSDSGNGSVQLNGDSNSNPNGTTNLVPMSLQVLTGPSTTPAAQFNTNGAYTLFLTITDGSTGATGTLAFSGKLGGSFFDSSMNLTNTFADPTTQSLTLGNHVYTVTVSNDPANGGYAPGSPQGTQFFGSVGAHVAASDLPEPSTLLLGGLGLIGGTLIGWRRRRALASR
jgi:hypothetical protein